VPNHQTVEAFADAMNKRLEADKFVRSTMSFALKRPDGSAAVSGTNETVMRDDPPGRFAFRITQHLQETGKPTEDVIMIILPNEAFLTEPGERWLRVPTSSPNPRVQETIAAIQRTRDTADPTSSLREAPGAVSMQEAVEDTARSRVARVHVERDTERGRVHRRDEVDGLGQAGGHRPAAGRPTGELTGPPNRRGRELEPRQGLGAALVRPPIPGQRR
jgi:hypothetical protein